MKLKNIYSAITVIAMIAMPAAAAINFGDAAYDALLSRVETAVYLAITGGIATGIGFEAVGILAGHLAVTFYSRKDDRWLLAAAALLVYIVIGMVELWAIPLARFVPLLAGLVYLLAGLQHEVVNEAEQETAVSAKRLDFELEQARLDREAEREMKRKVQADNTAVKLAEIQAKTTGTNRQDAGQPAGKIPGDWRKVTKRQRRELAHMTREKREEMFPKLSPRARRDWHSRLDEIAALNGSYGEA
jgi:lysylphosphatidylglycerol synthetase-like protein (DUF2156 family)